MEQEELFRPMHIHWDVTGKCNLDCLHCRATSADNESELDTSAALQLIDQIADIQPEWMSFDGGEPLLRHDIYDLISYASTKGLFTYLLSNGTIINQQKAQRLKECGISSVQVSVDGLQAAHDRIRGEGTFRTTIRGIENLLLEGIRTSIRITISRHNIEDVVPLLDLALQLGVSAFGARRIVCVGNAKDGTQAVEESSYLKVIDELIERGRNRIDIHIGMDPVLIPVTSIVDTIREQMGTLEVLAGCGAGVSLLHIGSNGDIFPCGVMPIRLGNVKTDPILDIWNNHPLLEQLRDRDQFDEPCGSCQYRYVCGGCRAYGWANTGNPLARDPQCLLPVRFT